MQDETAAVCGWVMDWAVDRHVGRTSGRAVECGRPAKARTQVDRSNGSRNGYVCGTHGRSAQARGQAVEPLPVPDVRPGQVWADNDHRIQRGELPARQARVVEVNDTHATVMVASKIGQVWSQERRTRIRLDRFRPTSTGYRLVTDTPRED